MAIEHKFIGITETALLTVPAAKQYAITTIIVCNTHVPNPSDDQEGLATFDLHLIPNGQSRGDINRIINQMSLRAGETFTFDSEKIIIESSDSIVGIGTPDDITNPGNTTLAVVISYLEI
jgi:hypothetical protein